MSATVYAYRDPQLAAPPAIVPSQTPRAWTQASRAGNGRRAAPRAAPRDTAAGAHGVPQADTRVHTLRTRRAAVDDLPEPETAAAGRPPRAGHGRRAAPRAL